MKREILLARGNGESRGAVLSGGVLSDYRVERSAAPSLVGAVYRARVKKAMPGLAAAVVEIPGGEAWLDLTRARSAKITEGATLGVQIVQDRAGEKRPRATPDPLLAGRFLAFQPNGTKASLSHRIADNDARARLGAALAKLGTAGTGSFLALHRAPSADDAALAREAAHLRAQWTKAEAVLAAAGAPAVALPPADPILDLLRVFTGPDTARIAVDGETLLADIRGWLDRHAPEWKGKLEREPIGKTTLDGAEMRAAVEEALASEIELPGGGALAFGEAGGLAVIDVDTDRASALSAKANFARVNREAAVVAARQIRLRNLGGRIVIDFAGLGDGRDLDATLAALRAAVADDPMTVRIAPPSAFGLVELIRRRERRTLAEMLGAA
jgi:ribonuclease G